MTTAVTIMTDHPSAAEQAGSPPRPAVGCRTGRPTRYVGAVAHREGRGVRSNVGTAVEHLLRQRADLPSGHPDRRVFRERAIESGLPLARSLASRYRERGEPLDDLCQVAAVGLIKAVDGYDPARSVPFMVYAVPTITGALKHHFRDTTWRIRVPPQIGVSQMQISRLLLRSLTSLRTGMRPPQVLRASTTGAGTEPAPQRNSR